MPNCIIENPEQKTNGFIENPEQNKNDFNLNFENYPFNEIIQYDDNSKKNSKKEDFLEIVDFTNIIAFQNLKKTTPFVFFFFYFHYY